MLEVKDLHASIDGKEILKGVNLKIEKGKVSVIMGPNGSGKSTLASVLMGNPVYEITKGQILLNGEDITNMSPDKRAKKGLFLSFQYPQEVPGVTVSNFLRTAYNSITGKEISVLDFHKLLKEKLELLKISDNLSKRYLNEGFSGGEKKRMEILQMAVLQPGFAILDETDSGTDVDALKIITNGINTVKKDTDMGILLITHYDRVLKYIQADFVNIMIEGKIVKTGSQDLAFEIEKKGYDIVKAV